MINDFQFKNFNVLDMFLILLKPQQLKITYSYLKVM